MKTLDFATVDVFTTERFLGNPLAIVHVPKDSVLEQDQKQLIAREFNFSETVFVHEDDNSPDGRRFDIFTIAEELPFAGHPTIGTLCYLGQLGVNRGPSPQPIKLRAKAGTISALYDHGTRSARADIPHNLHIHSTLIDMSHVFESQPQIEKSMMAILQSHENANDFSTFPLVSIVKGMTFMMVKLPQVSECLEALRVSPIPIAPNDTKLDDEWSPSFVAPYFYVILPRTETGVTKIRTRWIEPFIGEDPATGSAACGLAAYLSLQAGGAHQTFKYDIEQGIEMGRRSQIGVEVALDESGKTVKRVSLSGSAVLVTRGTIEV